MGQNYRSVYRAFGDLRPELGRVMEPPYFPYTFSSDGDFVGDAEPAAPSATHHLHPRSWASAPTSFTARS